MIRLNIAIESHSKADEEELLKMFTLICDNIDVNGLRYKHARVHNIKREVFHLP